MWDFEVLLRFPETMFRLGEWGTQRTSPEKTGGLTTCPSPLGESNKNTCLRFVLISCIGSSIERWTWALTELRTLSSAGLLSFFLNYEPSLSGNNYKRLSDSLVMRLIPSPTKKTSGMLCFFSSFFFRPSLEASAVLLQHFRQIQTIHLTLAIFLVYKLCLSHGSTRDELLFLSKLPVVSGQLSSLHLASLGPTKQAKAHPSVAAQTRRRCLFAAPAHAEARRARAAQARESGGE